MSIFDLFKKIENEGNNSSKAPVKYIVCGLGNPGDKYDKTRHNAGFMAMDYISSKLGVKIDMVKYKALTCQTAIDGVGVLLMKPQTFMNLSGEAVSEAANFFKVPAENIIVICDDITQSVGKIRIRKKGSAGGHNGLKSIISCLGNNENFNRIRVGIGEKPHPDYDLADWVLSKFTKEELSLLDSRNEDIFNTVKLIMSNKIDNAMNLYNK